jgi:RNA polymerase sigma factor (sigma-70 family)
MTAVLPGISHAARLSLTDLESVYDEYGPKCYGLALRIVRDHYLAEDVVQSVFENLARQPDRFEPDRGTLSSWLLTLTHHKAVDLIRWRQRTTGLDLTDDALSEVRDLALAPEDVMCREHERTRVVAALKRLRPSEAEVLVLAYFGGLSQREIAVRLDLPLGTVKGRTVKGLRMMRQHLLDP